MSRLPFEVAVSVVPAGKFRRYHHLTFWQHFTVPGIIFGNIRDMSRILHGLLVSMWILVRWRPDVVFAKGGYVCLPVGVAARLLRIPIVIHDSDTRPGLTNRVLARFAAKIATGSPVENYPYNLDRTTYTGVPIDEHFSEITTGQQRILKQKLGFDADTSLVVATGGGLGSVVINTATIAAAHSLHDVVNAYIIAGVKNYEIAIKENDEEANVTIVPFVYDGMADVLGAADIVVARGSATFIQELAGLGKPTIIVPAHQLGDQLKNAELYRKYNAAIVLTDADLASGKLVSHIRELLDDASKCRLLSQNLHQFARPEAACDVAALIILAAK